MKLFSLGLLWGFIFGTIVANLYWADQFKRYKPPVHFRFSLPDPTPAPTPEGIRL